MAKGWMAKGWMAKGWMAKGWMAKGWMDDALVGKIETDMTDTMCSYGEKNQ